MGFDSRFGICSRQAHSMSVSVRRLDLDLGTGRRFTATSQPLHGAVVLTTALPDSGH